MRKILLFSILGLLGIQAISQEIPEYLLENETVHRYLTEVQYDPNDYSYSKIRDYCCDFPWNWKEEVGVRLDFPVPVPVKFKSALGVDAKLYVSETEDYENAKIMDVLAGVDSVAVWNLIPGRTYNWKLECESVGGEKIVTETGKFKTTGTLRMLKIDNVFNVRDMGGWIGLGGHPMKYGQIVRGSRLNVNNSTQKIITEAGIDELRWVGMRAELDMRDASNSVNATQAFFSKNNDSPIKNINSAYNSRIATFANGPQSIQGINQLIAWLKEGKPVYLHCSVGADRTGTVAYLVGAVCGMSEDALCKEFELTSFSGDWIENERDRGHSERLIRQRDYTGRLDPNDNNESYKFAKMVDKIKADFKGETIQRKVYNHLKTGVNGTKVSEEDLKWLIKFMVDYDLADEISSYSKVSKSKVFKAGETHNLNVVVKPANHTGTVKFWSENPAVAKVSDDGVITAVKGGTTYVHFEIDGLAEKVKVKVEGIESQLPVSTYYNGNLYFLKYVNNITNGSFEYGGGYAGWKAGNGKEMSDAGFSLKNHENSSSLYVESKLDGDESSEGSIKMEWGIATNKPYVFGYRVKNSTSQKNEKNENLKVMNIGFGKSDESQAVIFEAPTYDGNWTDVQYVFDAEYDAIQIKFTHLSNDSNNTCLDNFYLCEIDTVTGVRNIILPVTDGQAYDLKGRAVEDNASGILIKDGKKYYNK